MSAPSQKDLDRLVEAAKSIVTNAYAPYSRQRVAAAILDEKGDIHLGVNVENAVNGASVCAEISATGAARAKGVKKPVAVAIAGEREHPLPPCGVCRQVLSEFLDMDTPIISASIKGNVSRFTLKELLPYAYGPSDLPS